MVEPATVVTSASAAVGAIASLLTATSQAKPVFWDTIISKVYSSKGIDETLDVLSELIGWLHSIRTDYHNEVERKKMEVPSETYKEWILRVTMIEDHVANLIVKYNNQKKNLCSDFKEEIENKQKEVTKLIEESNDIRSKLLVQRLPEPVGDMRAPDIENFETLQKQLDQMLKLLETQEVRGIRVHGSVGTGKTTIMMNLNNHKKIAKMFDILIWMKVSTEGSKMNLSKEHLQQIVLRRLKVNLKGNRSYEDIALRISKELECKKYLLLMDDVKQDLNLYDIGIPSNNNGSKIVLTTRQGHLCSSLVNAAVKVTCLSTDESWEMFKDNLQCPALVENPKIGPLAWRICNECGGLPLLIEKVASTFKVKHDECLWSDGLNSWRIWPRKECQGIIELYNFFKICYDDLDDAQKQ